MDELAAILPDGNILQIAGEPVDVSPLKLGEFARFTALLKDLSRMIENASLAVRKRDEDNALLFDHGLIDAEEAQDGFASLALEVLSSTDLNKILDGLALMSRQPRAFIDALEMDDAVKLLSAVIASNFDMFQKKLLPAITANMNALTARIGPAPSSASLPTGTD